MAHIKEVMDKLNSFETSDDVAQFLMEKGAKGNVQDSDSCVISNWILTETEALGCTTTETSIRIEVAEEGYYNTWEFIPTEPVEEFITKFDDWQYPSLIWERGDQYLR